MSDFLNSYGKRERPDNQEKSGIPAANDFFASYPVLPQQPANKQEVQAKQPPNTELASEADIDLLFKELNTLIGLGRVKDEVRQLINFVKVQDMRRKRGLGKMDISLHSVFMGAPGTGKTTVARIYGKMLKALGLLEKGHIVETDRAGLVGNYVGQTANKTDEKVKEAIGGVLFIDEAYSLYKGENSEWDYGNETIEVLMKRMEDNRNNLAVIVAGYPEPMKKFLNSNEGFQSRFVNYVHFEDYTPEELIAIFESFCNQNSYILHGNSMELAKIYLESAYVRRDERFGNARAVRNFFEMIIRNQALRIGETVKHPTVAQLKSIEPQDVYPLLNSETI
jgi:stage V sporulation protein K